MNLDMKNTSTAANKTIETAANTSIAVNNLEYICIGKNKIRFSQPSFSVKKGELMAITGRSGCGKTTFLNLLAGYGNTKSVNPNFELKIFGKNNDESSQRRVGYISQKGLLYDKLSLSMMLKHYTKVVLHKKCEIDYILEKTNLTACKKTRVANLSGGERKRAAFALELAAEADILFIDEPEAGLDDKTMEEIAALFDQLLSQKKTIICATHENKIKQKADKFVNINGGKAYVHRADKSDTKRPDRGVLS